MSGASSREPAVLGALSPRERRSVERELLRDGGRGLVATLHDALITSEDLGPDERPLRDDQGRINAIAGMRRAPSDDGDVEYDGGEYGERGGNGGDGALDCSLELSDDLGNSGSAGKRRNGGRDGGDDDYDDDDEPSRQRPPPTSREGEEVVERKPRHDPAKAAVHREHDPRTAARLRALRIAEATKHRYSKIASATRDTREAAEKAKEMRLERERENRARVLECQRERLRERHFMAEAASRRAEGRRKEVMDEREEREFRRFLLECEKKEDTERKRAVRGAVREDRRNPRVGLPSAAVSGHGVAGGGTSAFVLDDDAVEEMAATMESLQHQRRHGESNNHKQSHENHGHGHQYTPGSENGGGGGGGGDARRAGAGFASGTGGVPHLPRGKEPLFPRAPNAAHRVLGMHQHQHQHYQDNGGGHGSDAYRDTVRNAAALGRAQAEERLRERLQADGAIGPDAASVPHVEGANPVARMASIDAILVPIPGIPNSGGGGGAAAAAASNSNAESTSAAEVSGGVVADADASRLAAGDDGQPPHRGGSRSVSPHGSDGHHHGGHSVTVIGEDGAKRSKGKGKGKGNTTSTADGPSAFVSTLRPLSIRKAQSGVTTGGGGFMVRENPNRGARERSGRGNGNRKGGAVERGRTRVRKGERPSGADVGDGQDADGHGDGQSHTGAGVDAETSAATVVGSVESQAADAAAAAAGEIRDLVRGGAPKVFTIPVAVPRGGGGDGKTGPTTGADANADGGNGSAGTLTRAPGERDAEDVLLMELQRRGISDASLFLTRERQYEELSYGDATSSAEGGKHDHDPSPDGKGGRRRRFRRGHRRRRGGAAAHNGAEARALRYRRAADNPFLPDDEPHGSSNNSNNGRDHNHGGNTHSDGEGGRVAAAKNPPHVESRTLPPLSAHPTMMWAPALEYSLPPRVERSVAREIRRAKRDVDRSDAANMDFFFPSRRIGYNEVSVGGGFSGRELVDFFAGNTPLPPHATDRMHSPPARGPGGLRGASIKGSAMRGGRGGVGSGSSNKNAAASAAKSPPQPITARRPVRTGRPAIPPHILASTRNR